MSNPARHQLKFNSPVEVRCPVVRPLEVRLRSRRSPLYTVLLNPVNPALQDVSEVFLPVNETQEFTAFCFL